MIIGFLGSRKDCWNVGQIRDKTRPGKLLDLKFFKEDLIKQGIDGSARKPALRQDTGYMAEKTYHDIAPYLGAIGAYVMPQ